MKIHCGITVMITVLVIVTAVPTCRNKNDENSLYTCYLTDGVILEEGGETTISSSHEAPLVNDDVVRLYSNETATDLIMNLVFTNFKNLRILEFPQGIFENLSASHFFNCDKLEKFSVTNSLFRAIPENTFAACPSLKELHLGGNAINSLNKDSFTGIEGLTTLKLDDNQLITIPANIFDGLTNLQVLDISNNSNLRTFNDNAFKNNVNLVELNLAHNKFETLKKEYFEGLTSLTKLDATNSGVDKVEEAVFDKLSALRTALFKSNLCIDEDIDNFQASDRGRFQTCINNFNGAPSIQGVSAAFLLLVLVFQLLW